MVHESLGLFIYSNAVFLAERLHCEFPGNDNLHLLAQCHIANGDPGTAHRLLNAHYPFLDGPNAMDPASGSQWRCTYLYGVTCAMTGRHQEAERVLLELSSSGQHAGVSYWLGVCGRRLQRRWAGSNFTAAVNLNPSLFTAYENAVQYFNDFDVNPYAAWLSVYHPPVAACAPLQTTMAAATGGTAAAGCPSSPAAVPPGSGEGGDGRPPSRRAANISAASSSAAGAAARSSVAFASAARPAAAAAATAQQQPHEANGPSSGLCQAMALLRAFADAFKALYSYRCEDAVQLLTAPAMPQRHSGWVQTALALAHFHAGANAEAVSVFQGLLVKEPWRLSDRALVCYSTALWHLRDEPAVSHLAQTLLEELPESSVTMCVVGNAYSLAKDSKAALAMFVRARQVDPTHSYAHSLEGYECLALDQRSEAESAFREAIRQDIRHYNAYSGLGELWYRKENDDKARNYYQAALDINPTPALMNRYAMTYHRDNATGEQLQQALLHYEAAIQRAPTNFTAQHQRAALLVRLRKYDAALDALEKLKEQCPEEAMVYITMAHCLSRCGQGTRAVPLYHRAMDLDPRRATFIKGCLEKLAQGGLNEDAD